MTDPELIADLRAAPRTLPGWYTPSTAPGITDGDRGQPSPVLHLDDGSIVDPTGEDCADYYDDPARQVLPDFNDDGFAGQLLGDIIAAGHEATLGSDAEGAYCEVEGSSEAPSGVYPGTTLAR